ncbi:hypothetical protein ABTX24_11495 [Nocardioides sp. NPDC127514]|uniref:SLAC1 family transporter n=1 Tax=unclassified Nocardioides TaxID=2615069 RepID=UPI003323F791
MREQNTITTSDESPFHPQADTRRLPYSTLGIALGLAGTGSAWSLAVVEFGVPSWISEVLFAISAAWWLTVVVARLPFTRARLRHLINDIQHPITGPFPAYVPVVALLLTGHYATYLPSAAGTVLCIIWVVILTGMCAQMLAFWLSGALHLEQIHPGYALPVIAGPFIAAMTLTGVGYPTAGIAAATVGGFYWLTLGTVIFLRLIHGAPLPASLTPTLAVLVTPPATAGLAWFALQAGRTDTVQNGLAGVVVLFLCTQVFMLPNYLSGPFHLGYWAFSFPAAALASYSLRWAVAHPSVFTETVAVIALCATTALLLVLGAGTALLIRRPRAVQPAATGLGT